MGIRPPSRSDLVNRGRFVVGKLDFNSEALLPKSRLRAIRREKVGLLLPEWLFGSSSVQVHLFGPRSGTANDELDGVTGLSKKMLRPFTLNLRERGLIREVANRPLVFTLTSKSIELLGLPD